MYCAPDNTKTATLIRTIFVALKKIHKNKSSVKFFTKNISCENLKNRCQRDFSESSKIC